MKGIVISDPRFFINYSFIKNVPKVGDFSNTIERGDTCMLYIDTTCHACEEPKETSIALCEVKVHEVFATTISEIKKIFSSEDAEDFIIELNHQKPGISDEEPVSIITLFED